MGKALANKIERSPLSKALDHIAVASTGPANFAPYCFMFEGWGVGYDGIVAAGHRVAESLSVAPDIELFRHAVLRAGSPYSITTMPDGKVVVRGNKVRASIPTFPLVSIPNTMPDPAVVTASAAIISVLIAVSKLSLKKAESIIGSAILLRENSVVATDGTTIVEGWHGAALPRQWLVPREFADALAKCRLMPTGIGYGNATLTVWFGDCAWIRTNLYDSSYPDTDLVFAKARSECSEYRPIPSELLQAIEALKPFRETAHLQWMEYGLNTRQDGTGASYSFEHFIPYRGQYPTDGLTLAAAHGAHMAFGRSVAYWYGDVIRGVTSLEVK